MSTRESSDEDPGGGDRETPLTPERDHQEVRTSAGNAAITETIYDPGRWWMCVSKGDQVEVIERSATTDYAVQRNVPRHYWTVVLEQTSKATTSTLLQTTQTFDVSDDNKLKLIRFVPKERCSLWSSHREAGRPLAGSGLRQGGATAGPLQESTASNDDLTSSLATSYVMVSNAGDTPQRNLQYPVRASDRGVDATSGWKPIETNLVCNVGSGDNEHNINAAKGTKVKVLGTFGISHYWVEHKVLASPRNGLVPKNAASLSQAQQASLPEVVGWSRSQRDEKVTWFENRSAWEILPVLTWNNNRVPTPHTCDLGTAVNGVLRRFEGNPSPVLSNLKRAFFPTPNLPPNRTRDLRLVFSMVERCINDHLDDNYDMCYAIMVHTALSALRVCSADSRNILFKTDEFQRLCSTMFLRNGGVVKREDLLTPAFYDRLYGATAQDKTPIAGYLHDNYGLSRLELLISTIAEQCNTSTMYLVLSLLAVQQRMNTLFPLHSTQREHTAMSSLNNLQWVSSDPCCTDFIQVLTLMATQNLITLKYDTSSALLKQLYSYQIRIPVGDLPYLWNLFSCITQSDGDMLRAAREYGGYLERKVITRNSASTHYFWQRWSEERLAHVLVAATEFVTVKQLVEVFSLVRPISLLTLCKLLTSAFNVDEYPTDNREQQKQQLSAAFIICCGWRNPHSTTALRDLLANASCSAAAQVLAFNWLTQHQGLVQFQKETTQQKRDTLNHVLTLLSEGTWHLKMSCSLQEILFTIHCVFKKDMAETCEFIAQSTFLETATYTRGSGAQYNLSLDLVLTTNANALMETISTSIHQLASCPISYNTPSMLVWTAYCKAVFEVFLPLFRSDCQDVPTVLQLLRDLLKDEGFTFQAMVFSVLLGAINNKPEWWLGAPISFFVDIIYQYNLEEYPCAAWCSDFFQIFREGVKAFQMKLCNQSYTRFEYNLCLNHQQELKDVFASVRISNTDLPALQSWAKVDENYTKLRSVLKWLIDHGVEDAKEEAESVKQQQQNQDLLLSETDSGLYDNNCFVAALSGAVSNTNKKSIASLILSCTIHTSTLFTAVLKVYTVRQSGQHWQQYIQSMVRRTVKVLEEMCLLRITYGSVKNLAVSMGDINVPQEVATLVKLGLAESETTQRNVETALSILGHIEANHAGDMMKAFELTGCSVSSEKNLDTLLLGVHISNTERLDEVSSAYDWLGSMLKCLSLEHFKFFNKIARGQCQNLIHFFRQEKCFTAEGRETFDSTLENLHGELRHDGVSRDILSALKSAHRMFSPLMSEFTSQDSRHLRNVLNRIVAVKMSAEDLDAACASTFEIKQLYFHATAGVVDDTVYQLNTLTMSGLLHIDLNVMKGAQSTYHLTLHSRQGHIDEQRGVKSHQHEMLASAITDFRNRLHHLKSPAVELAPLQVVSEETCELEVRAEEFRNLFAEVDKIVASCYKLERDGHPAYQCRYLTFPLDLLDEAKQSLNEEGRLWHQKLGDACEKCSILRLFSNQELGVMSALLAGSVYGNNERVQSDEMVDVRKEVLQLHTGNEAGTLSASELIVNYLLSLRPVATLKQDYSDACKLVSAKMRTEMTHQHGSVSSVLHCVAELVQEATKLTEMPQPIYPYPKQTVCIPDLEGDNYQTSWLLLCNIYALYQGSLPCRNQVLLCSSSTSKGDVDMFFSRVKIFQRAVFTVYGIDQLGTHEQAHLQDCQKELQSLEDVKFAPVFYICNNRGVAASWPVSGMTVKSSSVTSADRVCEKFSDLCKNTKGVADLTKSCLLTGSEGCGKTHHISEHLHRQQHEETGVKDCPLLTISMGDLDDSLAIVRKLSSSNSHAGIHCMLPFDANWADVNSMLFELFICGTLKSQSWPVQISLRNCASWQWYLEITQPSDKKIKVEALVPVACYTSKLQQFVPKVGLVLDNDDKMEWIAPLWHANDNGQLHRAKGAESVQEGFFNNIISCSKESTAAGTIELLMARQRNVIKDSESHRTLMSKKLFVAYLYERLHFWFQGQVRFETAFFKEYKNIGSVLMHHLLDEANYLCCRPLVCEWNDAAQVFCFPSPDSQAVFSAIVPPKHSCGIASSELVPFTSKRKAQPFPPQQGLSPLEILSMTFNLSSEVVNDILDEQAFVLTYNFAFKLYILHQHMLANKASTKAIPIVIRGETGVGKTFLLELYTKLSSANSLRESANEFGKALLRIATRQIQQAIEKGNEHTGGKPLLSFMSSKVDLEWYSGPEKKSLPMWRKKYAARSMKECLSDNCLGATELVSLWREFDERCGVQATVAMASLIRSWMADFQNEFRLTSDSTLRACLDVAVPIETAGSSTRLAEWLAIPLEQPKMFYKLLVHPNITKEHLKEFLSLPQQVARRCTPEMVLVFFDEMNTSSCLGAFHELFMNRTLYGSDIGQNVFLVAAINPATKTWVPTSIGSTNPMESEEQRVSYDYVRHYLVHKLPVVMDGLMFEYKSMSKSNDIKEYVEKKLGLLMANVGTAGDDVFQARSFTDGIREVFVGLVLRAQQYFKVYVDQDEEEVASVSQRDIQRVFVLLPFFFRLEKTLARFNSSYNRNMYPDKRLLRCIFLAIATVYYFRLPGEASGAKSMACREHFCEEMRRGKSDDYDFLPVVKNIIDMVVTRENFLIPQGIALTTALKENMFCMFSCILTRTPLAIVGLPGSSKTLSYHIISRSLRGVHSVPQFCCCFSKVDTYFFQCSEYTTGSEIVQCFHNALHQQKMYDDGADWQVCPNKPDTADGPARMKSESQSLCVVFLDEASLPKNDISRLALKALHQFLDDRLVAFVALSNEAFDSANANRMCTVLRPQPTLEDLRQLASGCLYIETTHGLAQDGEETHELIGLCRAYDNITSKQQRFAKKFHHRDLIYLVRHFRRSKPHSHLKFSCDELISALEETLGGLPPADFEDVCGTFLKCVSEELGFRRWADGEHVIRNVFKTLFDIKNEECAPCLVDPLARRFQMIVDGSDSGAVALDMLFHVGLLDAATTHVFHVSEHPKDLESPEYIAGVLSSIRHYLELAVTIVLDRAERIHSSLYELLNQTFRQINGCLYTNISIGAKVLSCKVHPHLKIIVIVDKKTYETAPAPFCSRFSKFFVQPEDAVQYMKSHLTPESLDLFSTVSRKCESFAKIFHHNAFFGMKSRLVKARDTNVHSGSLSSNFSVFLLAHFRKSKGQQQAESFHFDPFTSSALNPRTSGVTSIKSSIKAMCSRLLQLMPSEHFMLKLSSFADPEAYFRVYFDVERYNLRNVISSVTGHNSATDLSSSASSSTKCLIYTRSTAALSAMTRESAEGRKFLPEKEDVTVVNSDLYKTIQECRLDIKTFLQADVRCLVFVINNPHDLNANELFTMLKCCIDEIDLQLARNRQALQKSFVVLMHCLPFLPGQHTTSAQFLRGWDTLFMDLSNTSNSEQLHLNMTAMAQVCLVSAAPTPATGAGVDMNRTSNTKMEKYFLDCLSAWQAEFVADFCTSLKSVQCSPGSVSTLPVQYQPLFADSSDSNATTLATRERQRALMSILEDFPAILKTVAKHLVKRFSQQRMLSAMIRLSQSVTQQQTFLSFPDLIHEYMQPEMSCAFQKVVLEVCSGFNFFLMQQLNFTEAQQLDLLELVPAHTLRDEYLYHCRRTSLVCREPLFRTPFFYHLRHYIEAAVKPEHDIDDIIQFLEGDINMAPLLSSFGTVQSILTDYIQAMCAGVGNKFALDAAKTYLNLAFSISVSSLSSAESSASIALPISTATAPVSGQRACSLEPPESCRGLELALAKFLTQIGDAADALRVIVFTVRSLTCISPSAAEKVLETDQDYIDAGGFLEMLFEEYLSAVWSGLSNLTKSSQNRAADCWHKNLREWREAYSFMRDIVQRTVDAGETGASRNGKPNIYSTLHKVFEIEFSRLSLLLVADVVLSYRHLCASQTTIGPLLKVVVDAIGIGSGNRVMKAIKDILRLVHVNQGTNTVLSLKLDLIMTLLLTVERIEHGHKSLLYLVNSIDNIEEDDIHLHEDAGKEVVSALVQHVCAMKNSGMGNTQSLPEDDAQQLCLAELLKFPRSRQVKDEQAVSEYVYIPPDFPGSVTGRDQPKLASPSPLLNIAYSLLCEYCHLEKNKSFQYRLSEATSQLSPSRSLFGTVNMLSKIRVAFECAVEEISKLQPLPCNLNESQRELLLKVTELQNTYGPKKEWKSFFLSRLVLKIGIRATLSTLSHSEFRSLDWVKETVGDLQHDPVDFSVIRSWTVGTSYATCSYAMRSVLGDKNNSVEQLLKWRSTGGTASGEVAISGLTSDACLQLILALVVFWDVFCEGGMSSVPSTSINQVFNDDMLWKGYIHLLTAGPSHKISSIQRLFTVSPDTKRPDPCCTIIMHWMPVLMATKELSGHYWEHAMPQGLLAGAFIFGEINRRGMLEHFACANPPLDSIANSRTNRTDSRTQPCPPVPALTHLGRLLNELWSYASHFCHIILQRNSCHKQSFDSAWQVVMGQDDMESLPVEQVKRLLLDTCLRRTHGVFAAIRDSEHVFTCDADVLEFVLGAMNNFLHSAPRLNMHTRFTSMEARLNAEYDFQAKVVNPAFSEYQKTFQKRMKGSTIVFQFIKLMKPEMQVHHLLDAITRERTSQASQYPALAVILQVLPAVECVPFAVPIAKLYFAIHRTLSHRMTYRQLFEEKMTLQAAAEHYLTGGPQADSLKKSWEGAGTALQQLMEHNCSQLCDIATAYINIGGNLQNTAVSLLVGSAVGRGCVRGGGILSIIVSTLIEVHNNLLHACRALCATQSNGESTMANTMATESGNHPFPMAQVCAHNGGGLVHLSAADILKRMRVHGNMTKLTDGPWKASFYMDAIEQSVLRTHIGEMRFIDWTGDCKEFYVQETARDVTLASVETLSDQLPAHKFDLELCKADVACVKKELSKQRLHVVMTLVRHLAIISSEIVHVLKAGQQSSTSTIGSFLKQCSLEAECWSISVLQHIKGIALQHIPALYRLCKGHISGVERLFSSLPEVLQADLCQRSKQELSVILCSFYESKLSSQGAECLSEVLDGVVALLLDNMEVMKRCPDSSLVKVLEKQGAQDDDQLLQKLPAAVKCCHTKVLLEKLVELGINVREKISITSLTAGERWGEPDDDGHVSHFSSFLDITWSESLQPQVADSDDEYLCESHSAGLSLPVRVSHNTENDVPLDADQVPSMEAEIEDESGDSPPQPTTPCLDMVMQLNVPQQLLVITKPVQWHILATRQRVAITLEFAGDRRSMGTVAYSSLLRKGCVEFEQNSEDMKVAHCNGCIFTKDMVLKNSPKQFLLVNAFDVITVYFRYADGEEEIKVHTVQFMRTAQCGDVCAVALQEFVGCEMRAGLRTLSGAVVTQQCLKDIPELDGDEIHLELCCCMCLNISATGLPPLCGDINTTVWASPHATVEAVLAEMKLRLELPDDCCLALHNCDDEDEFPDDDIMLHTVDNPLEISNFELREPKKLIDNVDSPSAAHDSTASCTG